MTRQLLKQLILRTPGLILLDDMRRSSDMICFNDCITVGSAIALLFPTDKFEDEFLAYVTEHQVTRIAVYLVSTSTLIDNSTTVRAYFA